MYGKRNPGITLLTCFQHVSGRPCKRKSSVACATTTYMQSKDLGKILRPATRDSNVTTLNISRSTQNILLNKASSQLSIISNAKPILRRIFQKKSILKKRSKILVNNQILDYTKTFIHTFDWNSLVVSYFL